ncbi:hypothetical protein EON66_11790 [archaeon]|nr:MAG: hypothetical protein EON66_11790 [archaeon]
MQMYAPTYASASMVVSSCTTLPLAPFGAYTNGVNSDLTANYYCQAGSYDVCTVLASSARESHTHLVTVVHVAFTTPCRHVRRADNARVFWLIWRVDGHNHHM